jgi:hypothetical protein
VLALAGICLSAAFAASARGATPTESGYACQLVRAGLIRTAYGEGSRVEKRIGDVSEAYGEGTYASGCTVRVTKRARRSAGRSARQIHLGKLRLFTVVPAAGAAAAAWDAEKVNAGFLSGIELRIAAFGGAPFPMPAFGQSDVHAYWLGNKEFSSEAFWRHADAGFVTIELHDRSESIPRLERLLTVIAGGIVPGFLL